MRIRPDILMLEYPAERLNRGVAIIRKNSLFAGSEPGGQRLAILYSFAAPCKTNNICFRKWLEDTLPRLSSTPANQAESLTMSLTTTGWSARKSPATCRRVTSASITRSTGPSSARRVRWSSAAPTTTGRSGWRSRAAIRRWCGIRGSASRRRYQPSATRSTTPEY